MKEVAVLNKKGQYRIGFVFIIWSILLGLRISTMAIYPPYITSYFEVDRYLTSYNTFFEIIFVCGNITATYVF